MYLILRLFQYLSIDNFVFLIFVDFFVVVGKLRGYIIDMEVKRGDDLVYQDLFLWLYGDFQFVQGVIGYVLYLDGNN